MCCTHTSSIPSESIHVAPPHLQRQMAEAGKKILMDQIHQLHRESEALQLELAATSDKYDQQLRKYRERKLKTKTKLHKARCVNTRT